MSKLIRPEGYATVTEADGKISQEYDTFTCAHGNEIVRCKLGTAKEAPVCMKCMRRICLKCQREMHATLKCVPFEKKLEEMEWQARFRKSLG